MKRIAIDCETNMAHTIIHLAVTEDIDSGEVRVWRSGDGLWDYLKDADLIAAHNGIGFDFPLLNKLWGTKIGLKQAYDTLVVSRLLEPTREGGHSLDAWGNTLGVKKLDYKATWQWMMNRREEYDGECFDVPVETLLEYYCKRDVDVLALLYLRLSSDVSLQGFSDTSVHLEHQVAAIIKKQETNGFKLDVVHATCLLSDLKLKMGVIYDKMQELYPPYEVERISEKTGKTLKPELVVFNPASRQQIAEKLIGLGWKPTKRTPKAQQYYDEWRKYSYTLGPYDPSQGDSWQVDETILQGLKYPIAQLIAEYMMLQKRIGQIESWLEVLGSDGRVHGRVITNGAVTGRMTHMKPNMAQVPAVRKDDKGNILMGQAGGYGVECRQCWTVDEGNVLVGCDASGLELRMLAHYMKDENYVKTVTEGSSKDGTDVHTVNQKAASLQTRDQAKTFIYAFLYGAGPAKIGSIVGGNSAAGQKLIDSFLKGTPALKRLRDKVSLYASKGYVPGLDGRKIWVRSEHAALNSLLQGAGAIMMKKALCILNETIKKNNWDARFTANVHDEFQIECKADIADLVGQAGKQAIIDAGLAYNLRCPLDGEYKVGRNWRETH